MKGRRYENHVKRIYEKQGYLGIRSAGSKSPIDLVAINKETKTIHLIQCKAGKINRKQEQTILEDLKQYEGNYTLIGVLKQSRTK